MPYNSRQVDDERRARIAIRRSLYTFWRRTSPYPSFMTFDATSREFCTVRRVRTNTPLQALTLLNDPASFEAARALARRMAAGGTTSSARAAWGVKLVLSRPAGAAEVRARWWRSTTRSCAPDTGRRGDSDARSRRMDDGRERAAEPRRGDHQRMTSAYRAPMDNLPPRDHPPPLLRAGLVRHRRPRARVADGRRGAGAGPSRPPAYQFDFAPKAKRVIYLFMAGAPSQLDLFDPKPALTKHDGQDIPEEFDQGRAVRLHQGHAEAARVAVPVQDSTASRARRSRSCCRTWPSSPTTSRSSARCRRRSSIMRRRRSS